MATLTDEERAAQVLGEEVEPTGDETKAEPDAPTDQEQETPEAEKADETESEEEKPSKEEAEPDKPADSTLKEKSQDFEKQFPNLKGETLEDYNHELETAYDNSFKEALRLDKENKDLRASLAQAQVSTTQPTPPANPEATQTSQAPANPALNAIDEHPAIQYAKAKQTEDMLNAFDDFKKDYPQATDQQAFEQFTKASDGINQALTNALGRAPTYKELFPAIAGSLGWQPTANDARKNNVIKENASSSRTPGSQSPAAPKKPKVSDAEVEAYMKMFTSKTREEAIKDLSEVK